ncbi:MAG: TlpA disulfide reductase family protein [Phycisphaerales bacterium]
MLDESVTSGKVVVLEFWATWCPSCVEQVPHLKKLYGEYRERGVLFIGISEDSDPAVVRRFVDKHEIPCIAVDEDHAVAETIQGQRRSRASSCLVVTAWPSGVACRVT